MSKAIKDCKGRDMVNNVMFYGDFLDIKYNEEEIRSHKAKSRQNGKIPKHGRYYTPDELRVILEMNKMDSISNVNMNFRNVQYLYSSDKKRIFWVYAIKEQNLKFFKFVGSELSMGILDKLMRYNGYKVGFVHTEFDTHPNSQDKEITKVYYNIHRSIVVSFTYRFSNRQWVHMDTNVIYRRFETRFPETTDYTGFLFNQSVQTAPIFSLAEVEEMLVHRDKNQIWLDFIPIHGMYEIYKVHMSDDKVEQDLKDHCQEIDDFSEFRRVFNIMPD